MGSQEEWVEMQTKTFTKWVNSKLTKKGYQPITDLFKDLESGLPLVHLLDSIGKGIKVYNRVPVSRILKMENVALVLDHLRGMGFPLVNIGPTDIVDGDHKLVLGLIWTIISRVELGETLSSDMYSMKNELLDWVKWVTRTYENVKIKNFTTSWKDGLAFNAIIHNFRPSLVDYKSLKSEDAMYNLGSAFNIAEAKLGIPKLLDADDIATSDVPDEKSIITYVLQYYHLFKDENDRSQSKEIVFDFLKALDKSITVRHQYEEKARAYIKERDEFARRINELPKLFQKIITTLRDFEKINDDLIYRSTGLCELYWRIQESSRFHGLKPYIPSEEVLPQKLFIGYFDAASLLDVTSLSEAISKFSGEAPKAVCKATKRAIALFTDQETQDLTKKEIEKECMRLERSLDNIGAAKQEVSSRLKEIISDHLGVLKAQDNSYQESVLASAEKLLKLSDVKSVGFVSRLAFKNILKALKLEYIQEVPSSEISITDALSIISEICSSRFRNEKVKKALQTLAEENLLNVEDFSHGEAFQLDNLVRKGNNLDVDALCDYLLQ